MKRAPASLILFAGIGLCLALATLPAAAEDEPEAGAHEIGGES